MMTKAFFIFYNTIKHNVHSVSDFLFQNSSLYLMKNIPNCTYQYKYMQVNHNQFKYRKSTLGIDGQSTLYFEQKILVFILFIHSSTISYLHHSNFSFSKRCKKSFSVFSKLSPKEKNCDMVITMHFVSSATYLITIYNH